MGSCRALYWLVNIPIKVCNESSDEAMSEERTGNERGLVLEEAAPRLKRPPLYQVILLNDDYTPMEFVVDVLQQVFEQAYRDLSSLREPRQARAWLFGIANPVLYMIVLALITGFGAYITGGR